MGSGTTCVRCVGLVVASWRAGYTSGGDEAKGICRQAIPVWDRAVRDVDAEFEQRGLGREGLHGAWGG